MKKIRIRTELRQHSPVVNKNLVTKTLLVFIGVLLLLQIIVSNSLATIGLQMAQIDQNMRSLISENADIKEQITSFSAFTAVGNKASELGFIKPVTPRYFSNQPDVAVDIH